MGLDQLSSFSRSRISTRASVIATTIITLAAIQEAELVRKLAGMQHGDQRLVRHAQMLDNAQRAFDDHDKAVVGGAFAPEDLFRPERLEARRGRPARPFAHGVSSFASGDPRSASYTAVSDEVMVVYSR